MTTIQPKPLPSAPKRLAEVLTWPLSKQIRSFVADARKVYAMPNIREDMGTYGTLGKNEVCHVCIGGAALAARAPVLFRKLLKGNMFLAELDKDGAARKVASLGDRIRTGRVYEPASPALVDAMALIRNNQLKRGRAPWRTYLQAANILEAAGL